MTFDVLILAPDFEIATHLWYPWLTEVLGPKLINLGIPTTYLLKDMVTQDYVFQTIQRENPKLIAGVGHGNVDVYTGHLYNVIWQVSSYPDWTVQNRNFCPVSCLVGQKLLPDMVRKGLGAGLGEDIEYAFWYSNANDPLHDPILALFTNSEFVYEIQLAMGDTSEIAYEKMKKAYYDAAKNTYPHIADTLISDADHRLLFGNPDWKLKEVPPSPPPPSPKQKITLDGYLNVFGYKFPIHLEGEAIQE
jgi:hypothetical protein